MIQKSTVQLLRFPFSIFLMPVYLFALTQVTHVNGTRAFLVFAILHLLVYPASNGYNSFMDRDETPIGGVQHPLQPTRQLFYVTVLMDGLALALSLYISLYFALGLLLYILASRAYSYRGIRLKKYPIVGYLTVILFQGACTFWLVHQHHSDKADGVSTISYRLGYRGTFVFCAVVYGMAMVALGHTFFSSGMSMQFGLLSLFFLPVAAHFLWWASKVWKDESHADFKHTMRMNLWASICTNVGFLAVLTMNRFE
jgi:1,4-dihydroxy-2-naphthoate octaprenyltransferase